MTPRGENGTIPERTVTCNDGSERTIEFPANNTIQMRVTTPGIAGDERIHYEVVTPRVQTVVRNLYNCSTLTGARLESEATNTAECAGTHWHERQFFNALLSAYFNAYGDKGQADVLSPLTLALLEDSGWYTVSYEGIGNFPYGLALGCDFATKDCIVNDTVPDYGKGIFCATVNNDTDDMEQESGTSPSVFSCLYFSSLHRLTLLALSYLSTTVFCDPSHTTFAFCDLYHVDNFPFLARVPENPIYYFSNQSILPAQPGVDNCPLPNINVWDNDCTVEEKRTDNRFFVGETYGPQSRCVNTVREGQLPRPACLPIECDADNFHVIINGIVCEFDGQLHDIEILNGTGQAQFECPRLSIVCPNLFCPGACSGRGMCNYNSTPPKCDCFDTTDESPLCNQGSTEPGGTPEPSDPTSGCHDRASTIAEISMVVIGLVLCLISS